MSEIADSSDIYLGKYPTAIVVGSHRAEVRDRVKSAFKKQLSWGDGRFTIGNDLYASCFHETSFRVNVDIIGRFPEWADIEEALAHLALIPSLKADVHISHGEGWDDGYPAATVLIRDGAWKVYEPATLDTGQHALAE